MHTRHSKRTYIRWNSSRDTDFSSSRLRHWQKKNEDMAFIFCCNNDAPKQKYWRQSFTNTLSTETHFPFLCSVNLTCDKAKLSHEGFHWHRWLPSTCDNFWSSSRCFRRGSFKERRLNKWLQQRWGAIISERVVNESPRCALCIWFRATCVISKGWGKS